jgi:hypothetical protein
VDQKPEFDYLEIPYKMAISAHSKDLMRETRGSARSCGLLGSRESSECEQKKEELSGAAGRELRCGLLIQLLQDRIQVDGMIA